MIRSFPSTREVSWGQINYHKEDYFTLEATKCNDIKNVSIIVAHFRDFDWIELLLKKILFHTDMSFVCEILIINQDRCADSCIKLEQLHSLVRVLEYSPSNQHIKVLGHDHPAVLNLAVKEAVGSFICILDSDSHPIRSDWMNCCSKLLEKHDAILARCSASENLTHPCFMVFKRIHVNLPILFDEELFTNGVDTGRLVGRQFVKAGLRVYFADPLTAFSGKWGSVYLGIIYHHGHGSFHLAGPLLKSQVRWKNRYFKQEVIAFKPYEMTFLDKVRYRLISFTQKYRFTRLIYSQYINKSRI